MINTERLFQERKGICLKLPLMDGYAMPDKIDNMKSKVFLLLSAFLISYCANSAPNNTPLDQGFCSLIKETINLDKLQQYYHVSVSHDRSPLVLILEKKGVNCKNLVKFGKPIKVINSRNATRKEAGAYLEIIKIDVYNHSALVNFNYSPEGIRGEITFEREGAKWVIGASNVTEQ